MRLNYKKIHAYISSIHNIFSSSWMLFMAWTLSFITLPFYAQLNKIYFCGLFLAAFPPPPSGMGHKPYRVLRISDIDMHIGANFKNHVVPFSLFGENPMKSDIIMNDNRIIEISRLEQNSFGPDDIM